VSDIITFKSVQSHPHISLATEAPSDSLNYSLRYINKFIYLSIQV